MSLEQGLMARLVRTLGFTRKEILGVFQQPRLLLTLVIGPFLILLVFGLGYRDTHPPFRTLLVLEADDAALAADPETLDEAFLDSIALEDVTTDLAGAHRQLRNGEVQLLIIAPEDPLGSLDRNEKADFTVLHTEVDPVVRASINLVARLSVDELNRRVLAEVVGAAQDESDQTDEPLADVRMRAGALVDALERGDRTAADAEIAALHQDLASLSAESDASRGIYSSVAVALGVGGGAAVQSLTDQLDETATADDESALENARQLEATLTELDEGMTQARDLDPDLLVSPFGVDVNQLVDLPTTPALFYAPGTMVLLIQQLALTLAALSLVRERELGLNELFQVSPLSSVEILTGKFLGFFVICGMVAAVLTGAILAVGVPLGEYVWKFLAVMGLVIVASVGIGFLIAGVAKTDSQAVQYTMIALLVSIFFTGYVLPLDRLAEPVHVVSYLIPATYGIAGLHDVMLRGVDLDQILFLGLAAYAVVMVLGAWWIARRSVRSTA